MPQVYTLVFETSIGAPSLSSQVEYRKLNSSARRMAASKEEADKEPMSHKELASLQRKDRGERKPSDIMVETFVSPGDESWAERAAASLVRKSSKSKETTPQRDSEGERRSKESSPAGASGCSKESTP